MTYTYSIFYKQIYFSISLKFSVFHVKLHIFRGNCKTKICQWKRPIRTKEQQLSFFIACQKPRAFCGLNVKLVDRIAFSFSPAVSFNYKFPGYCSTKISIIFLVQQIKLNNQIKIRQDRFGISCVCRQNGTEVKSHLLVTKYSASEPWRNARLEPRSQTAQRIRGIGA